MNKEANALRILLVVFAAWVLAWLALFALWFASVTPSHAAVRSQLVAMLEARLQMTPGTMRVLPDCGCTVRYLGTSVHGRIYSVQIEKLD